MQAGASAGAGPLVTVADEGRHAIDEDLDVGSRNHVGVGAELTILPVLPLRAGLAAISGGYMLSGGLGLRLGPAQLAVSAAVRETEFGDDVRAAAGFTFGVD